MDLESKVWSALEEVLDPEVQVNIVDLGLVYRLEIDKDNNVHIRMTMTIPECPLQDQIVDDVRSRVSEIPEVKDVEVELVWEPRWTPARMNDKAMEEIRRRAPMF
jgi:metal-sulfur cluster biosynthetic enzyme